VSPSDPLQSAKDLALRYIETQPRSRSEVERRLARAGVDPDVVEQAVADLERAGVIDDERLSQDWVESRSRAKKLGRVRLESELRRKGMNQEHIRAAVSGIDDQVELSAAIELARSRFIPVTDLTSQERAAQRRRLAGYLARRGYGWQIIEQVFAELFSKED